MNEFDPYQHWLGIPPQEQPPDHYRLLGISRFESDAALIQTATDTRMALVRTYQTGPRAAHTQRLLNQLATAKLCLLNPFSKAEYDAFLAAATGGSAPLTDSLLPAPMPLPPSSPPPAAQPSLPPVPAAVAAPPTSPWHAPPPPPDSSLDWATESSTGRWRGWLLPLLIANSVIGALVVVAIVNRGAPRPATDPRQQPAPAANVATAVPLEPPPVTPVIMQEASGFVIFPLSVASLSGTVMLESLETGDFLVGWSSAEEVAEWRFKVVKLPPQGIFRVRVVYFADEAARSAAMLLDVGSGPQRHEVRGYGRVVEDEWYLAVRGHGEHSLRFSLENLPGGATFGLKMIELSVPRAVPDEPMPEGPDSAGPASAPAAPTG